MEQQNSKLRSLKKRPFRKVSLWAHSLDPSPGDKSLPDINTKDLQPQESPKTADVDTKNTGTLQDLNDSEMFKLRISKIVVHAFCCIQMPSGSNMIKMLNIGTAFKKNGYTDEYYQSVFFAGLSMVSARKYVQSVEFFRNIQKHIFNILNDVDDDIDESSKSVGAGFWKSSASEFLGGTTSISRQPSTHSALSDEKLESISKQTFKLLIYRAAKLEILIADCCSQHSQLKEKLDAFKKATILYKIKSISEFRALIPVSNYGTVEKSTSECSFG